MNFAKKLIRDCVFIINGKKCVLKIKKDVEKARDLVQTLFPNLK